jgi:hypothetical protein
MSDKAAFFRKLNGSLQSDPVIGTLVLIGNFWLTKS